MCRQILKAFSDDKPPYNMCVLTFYFINPNNIFLLGCFLFHYRPEPKSNRVIDQPLCIADTVVEAGCEL